MNFLGSLGKAACGIFGTALGGPEVGGLLVGFNAARSQLTGIAYPPSLLLQLSGGALSTNPWAALQNAIPQGKYLPRWDLYDTEEAEERWIGNGSGDTFGEWMDGTEWRAA